MKLKCQKCGNDKEFYGKQSCRGTIDVSVDGNGWFVENRTSHGDIDVTSLNFDNPEGPWECRACGSEDVKETDD